MKWWRHVQKKNTASDQNGHEAIKAVDRYLRIADQEEGDTVRHHARENTQSVYERPGPYVPGESQPYEELGAREVTPRDGNDTQQPGAEGRPGEHNVYDRPGPRVTEEPHPYESLGPTR